MTDLLSEITFCDECPYSGEPNGCNRKEGVCKAHESYFDLVEENATLRKRLDKAVELPYERKRLLWGDKDRETLLCPDCLTDVMGGIGDETFVVQCPNCGCFVNCMVEPIPYEQHEQEDKRGRRRMGRKGT